MAIQIENGVLIEIQIGGQPIPPSHNVFKELMLYSGFGHTIPMAKLVILDMHNQFSSGEQNLVDGTKVSITIGKNVEETEPVTYDMLVFGKVQTGNAPQGYSRTAILIPDKPSYIIEAQREAIDGTSVTAIEQILGQHDLQMDSGELQVQDNMTWRNVGMTHVQHIEQILAHAYSGDQTCVKGCLDWDGTFYMRDLFTQLQQEPVATMFNVQLAEQVDNPIYVYDSRPDSTSGLFNALTNYGHAHQQHSLSGERIHLDEANPVVLGDGLALNEDIKNSIEFTTITSGGWFDSGTKPLGGFNMHEHYYDAAYLNTRHLSLFTESVRVITDRFRNLDLFAPIDYRHDQQHGEEDVSNSAYSGKYLITSKVIVIRESNYAEIYELTRSYITNPGTTPLVASSVSSQTPPKTNPPAPTTVDPADPTNERQVAQTPNPSIRTNDTAITEDQQLQRDLGEFDEARDAEGDNARSPLDSFIEDTKRNIDETLDSWRAQGEQFATENIVDKYGEGRDYLEAMGREFQSAIQKLEDLCNELLPSELDSLNIFGPQLGSIIGLLAGRVSDIDRLLADFENGLNGLIANGDIPNTFLNNPRLDTSCAQLDQIIRERTREANAAIPQNCLDRLALARLFLPQNDLARRLRDLERLINDMLCAQGNDDGGTRIQLGDA
jgi:hypothetical protein